MSLSIFYAVRFSPDPEIGEWLNVAVIGESVEEQNAGVAFVQSMDRLAAAFGSEAVVNVQVILRDLERLANSLKEAHLRGDATPPIPQAMRDQALSVRFSDEIVVFEGGFEDALSRVAQHFLVNGGRVHTNWHQEAATEEESQEVVATARGLLSRVAEEALRQASSLRDSGLFSSLMGRAAKPTQILVIGGADQLGSPLCCRLLDRGHKVRVIAPRPFADLEGMRYLGADYRNADKLLDAMKGVEAVVYLGPEGGPLSGPAMDADLRATRLLAEAAKAQGIRRFVFTSTYAVYASSDQAINENSPLDPSSRLATHSAAIENVLNEAADERFRPTILRLGSLYGFSRSIRRFDLLVNRLVGGAIGYGQVTMYGADEITPFVHIEDAAQAVQRVLEGPMETVSGQLFNVGSSEQNLTPRQVAEIVMSHVPTAAFAVEDGTLATYRVDSTKIKDALGFRPEWTFDRGVSQMVQNLNTAMPDELRMLLEESGQLHTGGLSQEWISSFSMEADQSGTVVEEQINLRTWGS